jgi:hypothetical protein
MFKEDKVIEQFKVTLHRKVLGLVDVDLYVNLYTLREMQGQFAVVFLSSSGSFSR